MNVAVNKVVTIEYSAHLETGEVVDSTEGCGPLTYLHGSGHLLPGLERRLEGMFEREEREIRIPPKEAYGEREPAYVKEIARNLLPPDTQFEVGQSYKLKVPDGPAIHFNVAAIKDGAIVADFNRPTAGLALVVTVKVINVREATEEESARGKI